MEKRFNARPVSLAKRDGGGQTIEGYAAVFYDGTPGSQYQLWDDMVERIMPGAFREAIGRDDVRCLRDHEAGAILGRSKAGTLTLHEDAVGLKYECGAPDTQCGRDTLVSLGRGDVSGSSFTFVPEEVLWREEGGVQIREIRKARLFDVGPVTFPAYEGTTAGVRCASSQEIESLRAEAQRIRAAGRTTIAQLAMYRARAIEIAE